MKSRYIFFLCGAPTHSDEQLQLFERGRSPYPVMQTIQLPVDSGGSTVPSESPPPERIQSGSTAEAPSAPPCPACRNFRRLLHGAVQTIRQQHSKFRALESSLDAQVHAALRELQILEYICRECQDLETGLTDRDVTELARRILISGLFDPRRSAVYAGQRAAADLAIHGFTYGSPMRLIPNLPSPDSDGSDMYDDLPVNDDASMSLDSSSASD
jgi:hypothetical protein